MTVPTDQLLAAIDASKRVLITTHVRPDGDALGSTAALALACQRKAIDAEVMLLSPLPRKYAFAYDEAGVKHRAIERDLPPDFSLDGYDALLVVDTGTWSQLPGLRPHVEVFKGKKLVVDHHLTQEDWADVKVVDTQAAAATEIVAMVLKRWGVTIERLIAESLFLGLVTDTGWFQYSNTRPATLRLAADLIEAGVDADKLYQRLYNSERKQRLALQTRALQTLTLTADDRIATMRLTPEDFLAVNATRDDSEASVNVPLQIATVEVSALLTHSPDGPPVRASLRSKGKINCAIVAQQFGGGGHARAAGCRFDASLDEAVKTLTAALQNALG